MSNKMLQITSLFALLAVAATAEMTFEDATGHINNYLDRFAPSTLGRDMCDQNTCCTISESEDCSITNFEKDETTLVLPGGETRCIYSYSSPFAFQVVPGDSDKMLFYFQGGGACWDELSTSLGFCTSDASPQGLTSGVFDRTGNDDNAFKSHTIVHVLYCSGDVHGGNSTRPYNDKDGVPVQQMGLANAQSALDWVVQQQQSGALATTFSELVVMGCSAGSIGAQLWAKQVLTTLPWKAAAVVPDSYAGVFPEGSMGPNIYDFGFCSSGFLSPALYATCMKQELTLQQIVEEFAAVTPTAPYAFVQSKTDIVQQSFYLAIGITGNYSDAVISPSEFYTKENAIFAEYNSLLPNFVVYQVDGDQHCFTPNSYYYSADPTDRSGNGKNTDAVMMKDWVGALPLSDGEQIDSICEGDSVDPTLTLLGADGADDNTYCSTEVVPKQFIEQY